jgi:hypothetical protein
LTGNLDITYALDQCRTVALQLRRTDTAAFAKFWQGVWPPASDFGKRLVVQDHEGWHGLRPRFGKAPGLEAFEQCGFGRSRSRSSAVSRR